MSGAAIGLMTIAILIVWGGLIQSLLFLSEKPEVTDLPPEPLALQADDVLREREPHPTRDT